MIHQYIHAKERERARARETVLGNNVHRHMHMHMHTRMRTNPYSSSAPQIFKRKMELLVLKAIFSKPM